MSLAQFIQRLLLAIPTLFGVSVVVFVLLRVVPGNPIAMMTPPGASAEDIAHLRALYGFDKSIAEQFILWISGILQGDLGTSISLRQDVIELIVGRLPATFELTFIAALMALALCLLLAMFGSYFQGRMIGRSIDVFASACQAVPDFMWGLSFILLLGVALPLFPISGRINPRLEHDLISQFYLFESVIRLDRALIVELLRHLFLPAAALALPMTGIVTRLLRASLDETMKQEYIMMARARGFSRWHILRTEALRNALIPTVALGGVQLTFLLGGTVLVERIFSFPGIGNMAIGAVIQRDLPLIQGLVLTFAVMFIVINLLVDLSYSFLNPKMRHAS